MPVPHRRRLAPGLALGFVLLLAVASAVRADDPGEALREAARAGDVARIDALLAAGAPVDAPGRYAQTPLYYAAEKGHLAAARRLVERGANVNAADTFFGASPLGMALQGGHAELALFLLEKGATDAMSALETAIGSGNVELARAALATGLVEPLDLAAARGYLKEVENAASAATAENAAEPPPAALRELLANATAKPRQHPPYKVTPERLAAYAGRYSLPDGSEAVIEVRGEGLALRLPAPAPAAAPEPAPAPAPESSPISPAPAQGSGQEIVLAAIADGRFDSADGNLSLRLGGRAGLIEWGSVNRGGEILPLSVVTSSPQPLRSAAAPAPAPAAPAEPARPWPQFRGPRASGIGDGQGAPAAWNVATGEGVRWKTPVPGIGLSSPIVWGDRIFVTTAVSGKGDTTFRTGLYGDPTSVEDLSEHSFRLYALDAATGRVVWEREVHHGAPPVRRHLKSSLANATPATDGERVVVLFGPIGKLAAYDFSGKQLWLRDVGILDCNDPQSGSAEWGHASSPILYGDLVLLQGDRRKDSFLAAYRLSNGEEVWRVARAEPSTWATPNVLPAPSGDELIANGPTIRAYDPRTGKPLWSLGPSSEVVVATPVIGDGLAYITAGYPPVRPVYAVRPGQRGDLTLPAGERASSAVAWSQPRGGTYIPTPLLYRGLLHTCNNNGVFTTYRAGTGEQLSLIRLSASGTSFAASPVAADGRIYVASEPGEVYVLSAGPEPQLLAVHPMGEVVMSTPAISGGMLIVRTLGHVYALAQAAGENAGEKQAAAGSR